MKRWSSTSESRSRKDGIGVTSMDGILNKYHKMGILLLCVMTLGLLARFGGVGMKATADIWRGEIINDSTHVILVRNQDPTLNRGLPTFQDERGDGLEASLDFVTDTKRAMFLQKNRGDICQIEDKKFQTLSSAVEYVKDEYHNSALIEMLTDYAIPAADKVRIPANCEITLSTAMEYEGEGEIAVISRAPGNTGFLFTNNGILNLGGEELGSQIILDGTGVEASKAMIFNDNHGTLNVGVGAAIWNADISGDNAGSGGAIRSAGTVNISGGILQNNSTALSGGAIYATGGEVNNSGGTITGNRAMSGGAVFAMGGAKVTVTGGTLTDNRATYYGGAIYVESGVTVEGGLIGGTGENDANRADNGAAIFVAYNGVGTFTGGEITGNVATAENGWGGAVGIGSEHVTLSFSGSPKITGNTITNSGTPANVCLDKDSENVINANDGLDDSAEIGIYVPGNGNVYIKRGVSKATFGRYISQTGIRAFKNDRTPKMQVQGQNNWLIWGKSLEVEAKYIKSKPLTNANLPPQNNNVDGNANKAAYNPYPQYYPVGLENYVSDIAADVGVKGTFACAFAATADTQYSDCISMINWDSDSGDWVFRCADGREGSIHKLIIYYADPTYISIANNTPYRLKIDSLTLNGIDAGSNRFGVVVARKGQTVEHFVPLDPETDFVLEAGAQIKWMFPNVVGRPYQFHGRFHGESEVNKPIGYSINGEEQEPLTPEQAGADFTVSGTTASDSNSTVEIVFGEETNICKIVELDPEDNTRVKEEHLYSSLALAVKDGVEHYEAFKVHVGDDEIGYDTVKIEMIRNYQIPSTDAPNIPAGFNFTLTTATPGKTKGELVYNDGETAQISRHPNNANSFITVNEDFDEEADAGKKTALTIENLDFDGRLVTGSSDGGAINAQKCSVTIQSCNFTRFKADNGGAVYVGYAEGTTGDTRGDPCTLHVFNCNFENCDSTSKKNRVGGGAIWTTAQEFALVNCNFHKCTAIDQGGAVFHRIDGRGEGIPGERIPFAYFENSKTYVDHCTFIDCHANAGGGLEIDSHEITVRKCTFSNCQAKTRNGGGFNSYLDYEKPIPADISGTLTVSECTFEKCSAKQAGGSFRSRHQTTVIGSTFTDSIAEGNGGGVFVEKGTLEINGGTIRNCKAKNGGGVYMNSGKTFQFTSGGIEECTASGDGGGVCVNNGTFTMSGGAITGNSAGIAGGGIAVGGTASKLNFSGNAVVYNNTKGGAKCNVELNYASNQIINTSGLGADALIGVYVPDENDLYENYGGVGDIFGSRTGDSNLHLFVNDRNGLRGWRVTDNDNQKKVHWVKTQSLTVRKEVISDLASDKNAAFHFTVDLNNNAVDGISFGSGTTAMYFQGGVAEFDLKHGEHKTALYIPVQQGGDGLNGNYTITETQTAGFTTPTIQSDGEAPIEGGYAVTGTFAAPGVDTHNVVFTNKRETGSLTISKTVDSKNPEDVTRDFEFTVKLSDRINGTYEGVLSRDGTANDTSIQFYNGVASVKLKHNETITVKNLPTGIKYTVKENPQGYNPFFIPSVNGAASTSSVENVDLLPGDNNSVRFTNTRETGGLEITKTVASDIPGDKETDFTFTVTLSDTSFSDTCGEGEDAVTFTNGTATFTLRDGQSKELVGLPYGATYTVTETPVEGFKTTSDGASGSITKDLSEVQFTNTPQPDKFIVRKTIENTKYYEVLDKDTSFKFRVELDDKTIGQVTAENPDGTQYGDMTFQNGVAEFWLTPGKDGAELEARGLPRGVGYAVTEVEANNGDLDDFKKPPTLTGTIQQSKSVAQFDNEREFGELSITKKVESSVSADRSAQYTFKIQLGKLDGDGNFVTGSLGESSSYTFSGSGISFNGGDGMSETFSMTHNRSITLNLPCGMAYKVIEEPVAHMTTTVTGAAYTGEEDGKTYAVGIISKDTPSKLTFTNTQNGVDGVSFKKVDGSGNPVPGAVFKLYTDFECQNHEENIVTTSDLDGIVNFNTTLSCGDHYMKEEPLDGYVKSEKTYLVCVGGDNVWPGEEYGIFLLDKDGNILLDDSGKPTPDIAKYGIMNVSDKKSRVILRKIGEDGKNQYKPLENAVFDILYWNKTPVPGASGLKSASNGVFWGGNLPYGKYYLRETTIPEGYAAITDTTENWFMFEVKADKVTPPVLRPLKTAP